MRTLKELLKEINDWQDATFTEATVWSAMTHLEREIKELKKSIYSNPTREDQEKELADVFFLLAAVAHLLELDLNKAISEKFEINKARQWGKPDAQGVVEHIRTEFCTMCGTSMPVSKNGRPKLFCGAACRQRAYRNGLPGEVEVAIDAASVQKETIAAHDMSGDHIQAFKESHKFDGTFESDGTTFYVFTPKE